ncbi:asparagine synthase (glutamine-hydrolyzing) [Salinarimonas soli]|uniref:asparagine synthase (glutamine-hydrolyzing) n=1 Tax=Salinarimonas soli TaxID=1638099 RepID=A0A5B2VIX1_9HYPH|nr:asparagine synthase (glutamine-hydrolyzing) [Salinarimonas soli]KAA2238229.1 asparagine synthase (glutamine-hydrolyzing) [Salinarimonas soli]
MCGVLAWVSRRGPIDPDRLAAGLAVIGHRGPDGSGTLILPAQDGLPAIGLAHARLAILDPTARAGQPFRRDGDALCYNGELYNFRELAAGLPLSTSGDTEVLLALLRERGVEALADARGMWAFVWLDSRRRRLVAARDRYGKKPLFYAADRDGIVLASEPAAIRAVRGGALRLTDDALGTYLAEGWLLPDPNGSTHLEGLREVRPGHALMVDLETGAITEAPVEGLWPPSPPAGDLSEHLAAAVSDRLVSDRPIGLLLSGGVDSSLILSVLAARGWLDRVTCFTGDAGKSDDATYARACIAATGARAVEIPLDYGAQGTDSFLAVCRAQAKPSPLIGNVLALPSLYRAIADRGVRVVLDGTGADEVFGGYWTRYAGFAMRDAARADDAAWLAGVRAGGMLPAPLAAMSDGALARDALPLPGIHAMPEPERAALSREGAALLAAARAGDPLVGFRGGLEDALVLDSRAGRLQEWLWQNDRNAMAAGVENRSPFLDHRLLAYAATPYHAKMAGRENKRELRALFDRFTPLPTARRFEKQGFRWVYGRFLRANRPWIADLVSGSRLARRVCDMDAVTRAILDDPDADARALVQRLLVLAGLEASGAIDA